MKKNLLTMGYSSKLYILKFVAILILIQSIVNSGFAQSSVQDYFNRCLLDSIEVLETTRGKIEVNEIQLPDGEGNLVKYIELINNEPQSFSGKVGVSVPLPRLPWWWQFAHWWEIDLEAVWTPTRAVGNFVLECFDENGVAIERIPLIERPTPNILGYPISDIPKLTNNMTPNRYHFPLVAVPKAKTSQPARHAERANLTFWFTDWHGTVRIKTLKIKPFNFTDELKEQWKVEGPYTFGGLPWFEPTYLSSDTSVTGAERGMIQGYRPYASPSDTKLGKNEGVIHDTLRDTGHKLLAAIGLRSMRYHALWEDMEPIRRRYDFEKIDMLMEELAYYGAEIGIMTVHGMPQWAFSKTIEDVPDDMAARLTTWKVIFPPDDWNDYETLVRNMVSHFKGRIKRWEVWNEPNSHVWGIKDPRKGYQQFLMRFYTEAKKIDPDCVVQCGRVGWWIHDMLREGMGDYMDEITLHPYPGANQGDVNTVIRQFREVQLSFMAAGMRIPIEVSEWGLGASYPWTGPGAQDGERMKAQKAEEILNAMKEVTNSVYWYIPIQANRQYGLIQYESDRYRPVDSYWAFGRVTGDLKKEGGAVKAIVVMPGKPVAKGQSSNIRLIAENTSDQTQNITFFPVGFVNSLGISSLQEIRSKDWRGTLLPGEKYETNIKVQPQDNSYGRYPLGLVVLSDSGNSVALEDLWVESIAALADVSVSSFDAGKVDAVNDLLIPVWSGDEDVPALVWSPRKQSVKQWVQLDFSKPENVSQVEIYWFADPQPHYPLKGRQSIYADVKAPQLAEGQRMDAHGMEVTNPAEDIKIAIEGYGNFEVPQNWKLLYRDKSGNWSPVKGNGVYPNDANRFNILNFEEIHTDALRIELELKAGKGGGVQEWRIN